MWRKDIPLIPPGERQLSYKNESGGEIPAFRIYNIVDRGGRLNSFDIIRFYNKPANLRSSSSSLSEIFSLSDLSKMVSR